MVEAPGDAASAPKPGRPTLRWLRPALGVLAASFVGLTTWDLARRWQGGRFELDPTLALVSLAPLLASCLLQGFGWLLLLERMAGAKVAALPALAVHAASQLARYMPGKVGLPLVRIEAAPVLGVSRAIAGASAFVETLSWAATGSVVGLALFALAPPPGTIGELFGKPSLALFALAVVGLSALVVVSRTRYPVRLRRLFAPDGAGPIVPARLPLLHAGYFGLLGLHGVLLAQAFGATESVAFSSAALFAIASVAGFAVLAAPAGLGVREAVLVAGLAPSLGAAPALGTALAWRAASLGAELFTWLLTRALARKYRAPHAP